MDDFIEINSQNNPAAVKKSKQTRSRTLTIHDESREDIFSIIYDQIIYLKKYNLFMPPVGNAMKWMITEMAKLIQQYVSDEPGNHHALKKLMCMPKLLLQKTHMKASTKDVQEKEIRTGVKIGMGEERQK